MSIIKKKTIRCNKCNKKNKSLIPILCKCNIYYCSLCKYEHDCSYDYKTEYKEQLKKTNPKIKNKKFERI